MMWQKKVEALEKNLVKTSKINERKELVKELPLCNVPIAKPKIKKLTNVEILIEIPFYDKLDIAQTAIAFK